MMQFAHMAAQVEAMGGHTNMHDDMSVGVVHANRAVEHIFAHAVYQMAIVGHEAPAPEPQDDEVDYDDE